MCYINREVFKSVMTHICFIVIISGISGLIYFSNDIANRQISKIIKGVSEPVNTDYLIYHSCILKKDIINYNFYSYGICDYYFHSHNDCLDMFNTRIIYKDYVVEREQYCKLYNDKIINITDTIDIAKYNRFINDYVVNISSLNITNKLYQSTKIYVVALILIIVVVPNYLIIVCYSTNYNNNGLILDREHYLEERNRINELKAKTVKHKKQAKHTEETKTISSRINRAVLNSVYVNVGFILLISLSVYGFVYLKTSSDKQIITVSQNITKPEYKDYIVYHSCILKDNIIIHNIYSYGICNYYDTYEYCLRDIKTRVIFNENYNAERKSFCDLYKDNFQNIKDNINIEKYEDFINYYLINVNSNVVNGNNDLLYFVLLMIVIFSVVFYFNALVFYLCDTSNKGINIIFNKVYYLEEKKRINELKNRQITVEPKIVLHSNLCDICYETKKCYTLECCNNSKHLCTTCNDTYNNINDVKDTVCLFCRQNVRFKMSDHTVIQIDNIPHTYNV